MYNAYQYASLLDHSCLHTDSPYELLFYCPCVCSNYCKLSGIRHNSFYQYSPTTVYACLKPVLVVSLRTADHGHGLGYGLGFETLNPNGDMCPYWRSLWKDRLRHPMLMCTCSNGTYCQVCILCSQLTVRATLL